MATFVPEFTAYDWLCPRRAANFNYRLAEGQRYGQAFVNSLDPRDGAILAQTPFDPFYKDDTQAVSDAIKFLLEH